MFVLSAICPPEGEAGFGKAEVLEEDPFTSLGSEVERLIGVFSRKFSTATFNESRDIARGLVDAPGREIKHGDTGLTFRIDPTDKAPHACPCCGRLVLPEDHAYADAEDAYCTGCFTWDRKVEACLPENTAHA